MFTQTFHGTYKEDDYGRVTFVTSEMIGPILGSDPENMVTKLDHQYYADCGINRLGNLVVKSDSQPTDDFMLKIDWETYCEWR